MIIFKKSKVVYDCFTFHTSAYNYSPIQKASEFLPSWWKKLPPYIEPKGRDFVPRSNMKSCYGMRELYNVGFVLPLWCDVAMEIGTVSHPIFNIEFGDSNSQYSNHHPDQRGEFYSEKFYRHIKLIAPWRIKLKDDIQTMLTFPTWNWHEGSDLVGLPGIVPFKHIHSVNLNFFIEYGDREVRRSIIHQDSPICHFIPLTDKKIEIRTHLVTDVNELNKIVPFTAGNRFISNFYKTLRKKKTLEEKKGKCPFH